MCVLSRRRRIVANAIIPDVCVDLVPFTGRYVVSQYRSAAEFGDSLGLANGAQVNPAIATVRVELLRCQDDVSFFIHVLALEGSKHDAAS